MKKLLQVKNLELELRSNKGLFTPLRGVDFHLNEMETLAIVGESGSGKSLTAKCILGMVPEEHIHQVFGSVIYEETDLLTLKESRLRHYRGNEIGFISQAPFDALNPTRKIGSQIVEGILTHFPEIEKREAVQRALELLTLVGIPDAEQRYYQYPHEFSGGMCQRIVIALILAMQPKILIADEPTTALDATIQKQILLLLKQLQKRFKMSIIFITHDLSLVRDFANRVSVMYSGKIVEEQSVSKIFSSPLHPYTQKLIKSIPYLDHPLDRPIATIPGTPPLLTDKRRGCSFCDRCDQAMQICDRVSPPTFKVKQQGLAACWLYDRRARDNPSKRREHETATTS